MTQLGLTFRFLRDGAETGEISGRHLFDTSCPFPDDAFCSFGFFNKSMKKVSLAVNSVFCRIINKTRHAEFNVQS